MKIVIFNLSKEVSDERIRGYIDSFFAEISKSISEANSIKWEISVGDKKDRIVKLIENQNHKGPLIYNLELNDELNDIYSNGCKVALVGEELNTINYWGDAAVNLTIIRKIDEKNLWHEVSHLLGSEDHYDYKTLKKIDKCKSDLCIMQHGVLKGTFCDQSLNEMKMFIQSLHITSR